jgi:hypothetical protein
MINTMNRFVKDFWNFFKLIICLLILFQFLLTQNIKAQQNEDWQKIFLLDKSPFNPYVAYGSDDIKDFYNPAEGKAYPSTNLFDGYLKTCWISGSSKTNKNAVLYIRIPDSIELDKIILNIFPGYGKSESLYYANARPKQISLSLFAAFYPEGFSTEVGSSYIMKKYPLNRKIELKDSFGVQSFPLNFDNEVLLGFRKEALAQVHNFNDPEFKKFAETTESISFSPSFIIKIEITEPYHGSKYDDVCISELFFNNRFITPYPDRYSGISNVYIKNNNTLLADFADKKGVVIYKDTSSVFTNVDWPKNKNWAVLFHVKNDAVIEGSRIEELHSLIDLKNREVVDSKFEKYTGHSAMFLEIEVDDEGRVYIKEEKYNIELW